MAVVTELEKPRESATQSPEIDDKPRGRKSTLPKVPTKTLTPEEFYAYTAALTEQDWAHSMGYVFRLWPRIIREPKNIEKFTTPLTELHLLETHGSGKYMVMLNDTDSDKTVAQTYPDFDSPNYPPRLDLRELDVNHEKNRTFVDHLKRTGKLTMDGDIVQPGKAEAGEASAIKEIALEAMRSGQKQGGTLDTRAFEKMMDMMSTASSKSIEIALGQVKKEDPAAFMTLVMEMSKQQNQSMAPMLTLMTTLIAKMLDKPAGPDPMMAMMMEQLKAAREDAAAARQASEAALQRAHEKEMAALENRAEAVDPMAMVEKVLNLQEKLGGGGPKDWKAQLVDEGMKHVPEILGLAERAIGYQASARMREQQAAANPAAPSTAGTTAQQPRPTNNNPPPAAPKVEMKPVSDDPDIAWLHSIFLVQGPMFVNAFRTDPTNGQGLAASLEDFGLKPLYTRAAMMGPDKIIATMKLIPQMWTDATAVGTEEMIRAFLTDFCEPPGDDDEEQPPPIPEAVKPAPKKKAGAKK